MTCSGDGLALEAALRFKKTQEEQMVDQGNLPELNKLHATMNMKELFCVCHITHSHPIPQMLVHCVHLGSYKVWADVLTFFGGDVARATDLVNRRRGQHRGTSTNRNTSEETFLVYQDQERKFTTTTIVSW